MRTHPKKNISKVVTMATMATIDLIASTINSDPKFCMTLSELCKVLSKDMDPIKVIEIVEELSNKNILRTVGGKLFVS